MTRINLLEWWESTFSPDEKSYILEKYKPMGGGPLLESLQRLDKSYSCSFLTNLSGWFSTIKDAPTQNKILKKAIEFKNDSKSILDIHFLYQTLIKHHYQQRKLNSINYQLAIDFCNNQIEISQESKKEFLSNKAFNVLPRHYGFHQLSIIYEKQNKINDAIELCSLALTEGWKGDWNDRIQRLKKKL